MALCLDDRCAERRYLCWGGSGLNPRVHPKGGDNMATHHGGKVGKAGKTLASKSSSKSAKSGAGKTLANHKASKH